MGYCFKSIKEFVYKYGLKEELVWKCAHLKIDLNTEFSAWSTSTYQDVR